MNENWKSEFDKVKPVGDSRRFNTYRADLGDSSYFIKRAFEGTDDWSRKSLRKERDVYNNLNLNSFQIPDVYNYIEDQMLCVDWVNIQEIASDDFSTEERASNLISDFVSFVDEMNRISNIDVSYRWPNDDEFFHRMTSIPSFADNRYYDIEGILKHSKNILQDDILDNNTIDRSVVHGDLFNPNLGFSPHGRLRSVIDWEMSGYFDQMYDVAFIESANLEIISQDDNFPYSPKETTRIFREKLDINTDQKMRLNLYKLWPYYVIILSIDKRGNNVESYMPYESKKEGLSKVFDLLESTVSDIDKIEWNMSKTLK